MESLPLLVELETSRLRMLVLKVRLPLTDREPAVRAAAPGARVAPLFRVRAPTLPAAISVPALMLMAEPVKKLPAPAIFQVFNPCLVRPPAPAAAAEGGEKKE